MTALAMTAIAANAPMTMPAMAPPDRLGSFVGAGDGVGVGDTVMTDAEAVMLVLVLVAVVDDALLMLEVDGVNKDKSFSWKATVMSCAHMVMKPDTTVNIAVLPSRDDVITSVPLEANTVVGPASVNMLVHP